MIPLPVIAEHRGHGPLHAFLLPGLVPDGPETFVRQLLRRRGGASVCTYPRHGFDLDTLLADLEWRLHAAAWAGRRPVLVGVSVGGGIALELLRRAEAADRPLPLAGCILVSPLTCTDDLAPLLRRLVDPILASGETQALAALERGRSLFRSLAHRSAPTAAVPSGWRRAVDLLTPGGLRRHQERALRARIDDTLAAIPAQGARERVASLRGLAGLGAARVLTDAPTLILWGSKERHTLRMDGPGTGVLCRPDLAARHFPDAEVHWVYAADGEEVPHASLIRHHRAFNPHLTRFLRRIARDTHVGPTPGQRRRGDACDAAAG